MKVAVIGSNGFIGSHLSVSLEREGYDVFVCDVNESFGQSRYFRFDGSSSGYDDLFQSTQFDFCINCSGSASVPFSYQDPATDFRMNVVSMFQMLDSIRRYQKSCNFIQLSSAAVYGNPRSLPVRTDDIIQPLSVYGFHKKMAEEICLEFHQIYDLPVSIVRIFSAYGPGLRKQLFWDLYEKAKKDEVVRLFGTGDESRDFIYIDDLIQAIVVLMKKGNRDGFVYNLASGEQVYIREAVRSFMDCYAPTKKYEFTGETREGDPMGWQADISPLLSLGFKPAISFEEGIRKYATWLQQEK